MFDKSIMVLISVLIFSTALFAAEDIDLRKRRAGSPGVTMEQLTQLADDSDWRVRQAVARNRKTPAALLEKLARDRDPQVRIGVATNLATTETVFMILAVDPDEQVRSVTARFEYVPVAVLAKMASDKSADIRLEVARNLNTSRDTLRLLSHDPQPEVAQSAAVGLQRNETQITK